MGHIVFDAVVATGFGVDGVQEQVQQRVEVFRNALPPEWQRLVVGPIPSITNGYDTYFFAADGSKSGWDTDEQGDAYRKHFFDIFLIGYYDVVEIKFGGDEDVAGARRAVLNLKRRDGEVLD